MMLTPASLEPRSRRTFSTAVGSCVITAMIVGLGFRTVSAKNFGQTIPLTRASAATYYVSGNISGHGDVELLVDTGSTYMVVDEPTLHTMEENGYASYLRKLRGSMADGTERIVKLYRIDAIDIGGSCLINDVEVAAFPAGAQPILGLSALFKVSPFVFSMNPPQLDLSHCGEQQASIQGGRDLPGVSDETRPDPIGSSLFQE